ncbi:hypothetical protein GHT06_018958 [Daphnia sinensis]|uniref:EEF1A lysine methyltransferase 4 n=1 Tax=Daphnia sinensis TaxID=1820382 RepID=A0AAD5KN76_9CRUS|nr:hypothetical protein GHT06_018958 [Daphnia sinensis]
MSFLPDKNTDYASVAYWNERYGTEESFEWCKSYAAFKDLIRKEVQPTDRILMLGCGNSSLSEDMYRDGFHRITNVDYSSVVVENMKNRSSEARSMQWLVMDIKDLKFESGSFDVVIEKATLDALLVAERDPWRLSENGRILMDEILIQVSNVLSSNGRFISITFAQPHFRKRLYAREQYGWNIRTETFGDGFHFFFYVMTKGERLSEQDAQLQSTWTNHNLESQSTVARFQEDNNDDSYLNSIEM